MFEWRSWLGVAIAVAISLVAVVALVGIASLVLRLVAKRAPELFATIARPRRRLRVVLAIAGSWMAVTLTLPNGTWLAPYVGQAFLVAFIASSGWLVSAVVSALIDRVLVRYPVDVVDNRVARRVRTQMLIVRRLLTVVIVIVTIGSVLLTFPGASAAGASLLASAGLVSVMAGLAAQSTLGNVFAGMQLAFSDAIRVQDIVVAGGQWGRIEEITLTYVVVSTWDQRRLVLPSTHFTSTPFENWTRTGSELLGAVEFDLDWRIDTARLRSQLDAILAETPLWDGRASNVQVTDAIGGYVRVRVMVSGANAGALWDLRCHVREELIGWIQAETPDALPRTRVLVGSTDESTDGPTAARGRGGGQSGLFSGTPDAEERGRQFTGPVSVVTKVEKG